MSVPSAPVSQITRNAPNAVANEAQEVVASSPWVEALARLGWGAKGVVYILMGLTAFTVARHEQTDDDASPEGALGQVMQNPAGRVLLAVLSVGLVLYVAWRLLSAALVRGNELNDWLHRIGYVFSAAFYALLAWTAAVSVLRDVRPEDSNAVERLSKSLLGSTFGRWALGALGLVIMVVGVYFIVKKSLGRSFLDELSLGGASEAERRAVTVSGVIGWFGRGIVTLLVGVFVTKAAIEVDTDDARGFDRSLREVATHWLGTFAVATAAVGLIAYGVFCLVSIRHQELKDNS
jgi:uncharacterized protein DUF1206